MNVIFITRRWWYLTIFSENKCENWDEYWRAVVSLDEIWWVNWILDNGLVTLCSKQTTGLRLAWPPFSLADLATSRRIHRRRSKLWMMILWWIISWMALPVLLCAIQAVNSNEIRHYFNWIRLLCLWRECGMRSYLNRAIKRHSLCKRIVLISSSFWFWFRLP